MPQALVEPEYSQDPSSHVSLPNSPGCGMVWNSHSSSPVRTSKPRTSPGASSWKRGPSKTTDPMTTTSPTTIGTDINW